MLIPDRLKTQVGLSELLQGAFTPDEFRRFVATESLTASLVDHLTTTAEDATFFFESAGLLVRRGIVDQAGFWVALQAARPHKELVPAERAGGAAGGGAITLVLKGPKGELSMALVARIEEMLRLHAPGAEIERVTRGSLRVDLERANLAQLAVVRAHVAEILPPDVAVDFEFPLPEGVAGGGGAGGASRAGWVFGGLAAGVAVLAGAAAVALVVFTPPAVDPNPDLVAENQALRGQAEELRGEVGEVRAELGATRGELEARTAENAELKARVEELGAAAEAKGPARLWTVDARVRTSSDRVSRALDAESMAELQEVLAVCGGESLPTALRGRWAWLRWQVDERRGSYALTAYEGGEPTEPAAFKSLASCLTRAATRSLVARKVSQGLFTTVVIP